MYQTIYHLTSDIIFFSPTASVTLLRYNIYSVIFTRLYRSGIVSMETTWCWGIFFIFSHKQKLYLSPSPTCFNPRMLKPERLMHLIEQ